MTWLLARETIIVLAVAGAAASMLASLLQRKGRMAETGARRLNALGYGLMTVSMVLFIVAGLRAGPA